MSLSLEFQKLIDLEELIGSKISFLYKNYKGITSWRTVKIISLRKGSTEWHNDEQWLVEAYDYDREAEREFSVKDIISDLKLIK